MLHRSLLVHLWTHHKFKRMDSGRKLCPWISEYGAKFGFLRSFQLRDGQRCFSHIRMCIIEGYWKWCAVKVGIVWAWCPSDRLGWRGSLVLCESQWYTYASPGLVNGRTLAVVRKTSNRIMRVVYVVTGRLTRMNNIWVWNYPPRACSPFLSWSTYKNTPMIVCPRSIQSYRSAVTSAISECIADYIFMRGSAGDSIVWNFDNSGSSGLITSGFSVRSQAKLVYISDAICKVWKGTAGSLLCHGLIQLPNVS